MDIATTSLAERIARVLAAEHLSANAEGSERSAGAEVDACWQNYLGQAGAVLRTMREPDRKMAAVGDPLVWERMVLAALEGH